MPFPIKPMHELEEHNDLFGVKDDGRSDLSDIQQMFLGGKREAAKQKHSETTLNLLETIYNSLDKLSSAASSFSNPHREASSLYRVPDSISDNELLSLKTAGLISGAGRSVKLSDSGRVALRDKWLCEENSFNANRTKTKFDIKAAGVENRYEVRAAKTENKFRVVKSSIVGGNLENFKNFENLFRFAARRKENIEDFMLMQSKNSFYIALQQILDTQDPEQKKILVYQFLQNDKLKNEFLDKLGIVKQLDRGLSSKVEVTNNWEELHEEAAFNTAVKFLNLDDPKYLAKALLTLELKEGQDIRDVISAIRYKIFAYINTATKGAFWNWARKQANPKLHPELKEMMPRVKQEYEDNLSEIIRDNVEKISHILSLHDQLKKATNSKDFRIIKSEIANIKSTLQIPEMAEKLSKLEELLDIDLPEGQINPDVINAISDIKNDIIIYKKKKDQLWQAHWQSFYVNWWLNNKYAPEASLNKSVGEDDNMEVGEKLPATNNTEQEAFENIEKEQRPISVLEPQHEKVPINTERELDMVASDKLSKKQFELYKMVKQKKTPAEIANSGQFKSNGINLSEQEVEIQINKIILILKDSVVAFVKKLIRVANVLDEMNYLEEASIVDEIIKNYV